MPSAVLPVHLAIPECKLVPEVPAKRQLFSHIVPGLTPYQFHGETRSSATTASAGSPSPPGNRVGIACGTTRSSANGTIPFFPDLEHCPAGTLSGFPKDLVLSAMSLVSERPWRTVSRLVKEGPRALAEPENVKMRNVLGGVAETL